MTTLGPYALGRVHHADCLDALRLLPDGCVQMVCCSPPYWSLRKYDVPDLVFDAGPAWPGGPPCEHWFSDAAGSRTVCKKRDHGHGGFCNATGTRGLQGHNGAAGSELQFGAFCRICGAWRGQLGLEPTPELYVAHLVGVFREVRRVLRDDGTLWLNEGDSYSGSSSSGSASTSTLVGTPNALRPGCGPGKSVPPNCKPKDLVGIPWLLAFALRADGWFLRAEIIWHKVACMPESVRDRPTRAHEQVFLLSKSGTYFYDAAAASEPATNAGHVVALGAKSLSKGSANAAGILPSGNGAASSVTVAARRNWRTVWTIGPEPNNAQHYAPFPRELARRCIVAGSRVGDVVLDPFAGTGTTVRVADGLGRKALGFDLGEKYVEQANERSGEVRPADAKQGQQCGIFAEVKP